MDIFNIIVGSCTIIGLFVSIFTANKVYKMSKKVDQKQKAKAGDHSKITQVGRDMTITREKK